MLKISERLIEVASLVPKGCRLADVGTDHGYVPIWLLQNQYITSAIAMDVNRGPLKRAEENRDKYGFAEVMDIRLSDGLEKLRPGEADTVLIAGMGGPLMIRILEEGRANAAGASTWVLQPQSEIPSVRRYLIENGFDIVRNFGNENIFRSAADSCVHCDVSASSAHNLYERNSVVRSHSVS